MFCTLFIIVERLSFNNAHLAVLLDLIKFTRKPFTDTPQITCEERKPWMHKEKHMINICI